MGLGGATVFAPLSATPLSNGFSFSFSFVPSSQEQKRCVECSTLQREVKKVRKARNRRHEWNMMAFDKELRPDHRHPQTLRRGASSEGSLSPDGRLVLLFYRVSMCLLCFIFTIYNLHSRVWSGIIHSC